MRAYENSNLLFISLRKIICYYEFEQSDLNHNISNYETLIRDFAFCVYNKQIITWVACEYGFYSLV